VDGLVFPVEDDDAVRDAPVELSAYLGFVQLHLIVSGERIVDWGATGL